MIVPGRAPPPPAIPVTRTGDLWRCGEHRLLCGDAIRIEDVHRALGTTALLRMNPLNEHPQCGVQQAVNRALNEVMREAQALLEARLGQVTLADLAADFGRQQAGHSHAKAGRPR